VVVVAFGYILPPEVLAVPRLGCVNVHFSLLPRWRGAAPVERALMAGDTRTGITTMLMDEGLDTGPVLLVRPEPIEGDDTAGTLLERLGPLGADLVIETLEGLAAGTLHPRPQPTDGVTYANKIDPAEGELSFDRPAWKLVNLVRALNPSPGAFTWHRGKRLKVWRAQAAPGSGEPGILAEIASGGPAVGTAEGRLVLLEVQPEGKRAMSGSEFARGYRPEAGDAFGR
jgi:methionyl-tRNA formyltransferase